MTNIQAKFLQDQNNIWFLELMGDLDQKSFELSSIQELPPLLEYLLKLGVQRLAIDLLTTEHLDSQGLQLLLVMQRQFTREKIQIVLCNPSSRLKRLLRVMQFDRIFEIEEDSQSNPLSLFLAPQAIRRSGF